MLCLTGVILKLLHQRSIPPLLRALSYLFSTQSTPLSSLPPPPRQPPPLSSQTHPLLFKEIFEIPSNHNPSSLHSLLLKLARSHNFSHSDSVLAHLLSSPSPSSSLPICVLSRLFCVYAESNRPDKALDTFHLLLRSGFHPIPTKLFNRLLSVLLSDPEYTNAALSLFESAETSYGLVLDTMSYNLMIHALSLEDKLSVACKLFNQMFKRQVMPDVETYRIMMQGMCKMRQFMSAVGLLEDMLNKGFVPDAQSYTTLLNGLCRRRKFREAYKLLCRMKVRGCNPNIVHYNTVIVGFCREGRSLDARKVITELMPSNGCLPDLVSYTMIINGLWRQGFLEEARRYLEEMVSKGLSPHFSTFHGLVRGFCNVGKYDEACGGDVGMWGCATL
ncbi:hypothetical protein QJS10_CPA10g00681 [Acorus calamus]|uniref:Pentatricopeptide repeat-containing protein n=1 Tax=Acorus calamus TaxID=4465 RepID=A0AAV9DVB5_ACOCL|nr:hypothetical protein QJS10_CPA10g00681 [Acorus calamus]